MAETSSLCANCHQRPGTLTWVGEGGTLAFTHGLSQQWCESCVVSAQLTHARASAARIPTLESRLNGLRTVEALDISTCVDRVRTTRRALDAAIAEHGRAVELEDTANAAWLPAPPGKASSTNSVASAAPLPAGSGTRGLKCHRPTRATPGGRS